jgi:tripartite-type tricarboxylate transporter receptor subunit TctC
MNQKKGFRGYRVTLLGVSIAVLGFLIVLLSGEIGVGKEMENYPNKPIDLIVAFPPGGGGDLAGRLVSQYLGKKWGQTIRVVNIPGGGAVPGTQQAIESKPDGYTLFVDPHVTAALMPAVYETLPFDWTKRTWLGLINIEPVFYLVNANSPYKTLSDLTKAVKEQPQKFSWGGTGRAGTATFALGQFFYTIGVKVSDTNMVSLQGTSPALTALAGGHIDIAAGQLGEVYTLISAGKIRALAVNSKKRMKEFPDVPTVAEAGYPNLDVFGWQGISGPAGLPQYVITKWAEGLKEASTNPEFLALAEKSKKAVYYLGPEDFKVFATKEYERFLELAKKMGLRS